MEKFYYAYVGLLLICLMLSTKKENIKSFLWIYFGSALLVDLYMFFGYPTVKINIHPYAISFYILFFTWYYRNIFSKTIFYIICLAITILSTYIIITSQYSYDQRLIILMAIFYFGLPLHWFYKQITNVDETVIYKKQKFWVSVSLLIWITFFIFKMIPIQYFYKNDNDFLLTLDLIFQVINIASYLLFIQALLVKK